ncbi:hypothetical protein K491DRAFT_721880 [Lophiostoma macrostomum CBS 122681]|uniref:Uncharacterized protein n=1 Tax=Lophiostoma macrostomum CBS 122681 TaxID=1314788 RepID=A0A6A6SMX0_9PLEO|nr:hypothetical protein K491DRAFT_721880 [Lophiostoma macrostomum CBS 122681]
MSEQERKDRTNRPHDRPTLRNGVLERPNPNNSHETFNLRECIVQLVGGLLAVCLVVIVLKGMMLALQYSTGGNGYYRQGGRGWLGQDMWVGDWERVQAGEQIPGGPQEGDGVVHVHVRIPPPRGF